jgi:cell division septation protein DedD
LKPGATAEDSTAEPPTPVESTPEQSPTDSAATRAPADRAASFSKGPQEAARENWVVQVAALRDRSAAIAIIRRLSNRGYQAFIVEPRPGAPAPGYRVRVGPFQDRRQAEQVSRRLEREEQFKPFITR